MARTVQETIVFAAKISAALVLLTGLAACQSSREHEAETAGVTFANAEDRALAAQTSFENVQRLWRVGAPLLVEGSPLCGRRQAPYTGIHALARQDLEGDLAGPLADHLRLTDRPMVVSVDAGSPAEAAGVQVGDRLMTVGNSEVASGLGQGHFSRLLYSEAEPGKAVTLKLGRDRGPDYVMLVPKSQCDFILAIEETDELEASADGKRITLSVGLIEAAQSDEQLASAIANGMARNTLRQGGATAAAVAVAGVTGFALDLGFLLILQPTNGAFTKLAGYGALSAMQGAYEPEADRRTAYFLARAGYDPETVIELFDLFNESPFKTPETTKNDPAFADRLSDIQDTIDEIRSKQDAGLPLIPDDLATHETNGGAFDRTDYQNQSISIRTDWPHGSISSGFALGRSRSALPGGAADTDAKKKGRS